MEHLPAKRSEATRRFHQNDAYEEDDKVKQLDECSYLYLVMQDCVAVTNRNWKECQPEVEALKQCFERRKRNGGA
ncbi:hypothetical protein VNO77_01628 [Canavalia gladiata]|uniref:Uncharacterized protein n=1 Tax=Canavalia gladiata TaxID=3824 RepID=A0AAN9MTG7_CANGL